VFSFDAHYDVKNVQVQRAIINGVLQPEKSKLESTELKGYSETVKTGISSSKNGVSTAKKKYEAVLDSNNGEVVYTTELGMIYDKYGTDSVSHIVEANQKRDRELKDLIDKGTANIDSTKEKISSLNGDIVTRKVKLDKSRTEVDAQLQKLQAANTPEAKAEYGKLKNGLTEQEKLITKLEADRSAAHANLKSFEQGLEANKVALNTNQGLGKKLSEIAAETNPEKRHAALGTAIHDIENEAKSSLKKSQTLLKVLTTVDTVLAVADPIFIAVDVAMGVYKYLEDQAQEQFEKLKKEVENSYKQDDKFITVVPPAPWQKSAIIQDFDPLDTISIRQISNQFGVSDPSGWSKINFSIESYNDNNTGVGVKIFMQDSSSTKSEIVALPNIVSDKYRYEVFNFFTGKVEALNFEQHLSV